MYYLMRPIYGMDISYTSNIYIHIYELGQASTYKKYTPYSFRSSNVSHLYVYSINYITLWNGRIVDKICVLSSLAFALNTRYIFVYAPSQW